jgi:hypothetical protein
LPDWLLYWLAILLDKPWRSFVAHPFAFAGAALSRGRAQSACLGLRWMERAFRHPDIEQRMPFL